MAPQPDAAQERETRKGRIGWVAAWALSVVLAFILGHQMGAQSTSTEAGAPASPARPTPNGPTAAPTPDPEVLELLRRLPRRQADDPLAKGAVDAKVVLTEWSDFRCPYCARWATETLPELQRLVDDGTLRVEYRDLAILGEDSVTTAVAGRAAAQQGRFWEFYAVAFDDLAQNAGQPQRPLVELARAAGVPDLARFEADLADPAFRDAVGRDTQEAQQLGITGTPFFVIDTTVINGARPAEEFIATIEAHAND